VQELRQNGCEVVSIADGFDLNGPAAEIVLAVLSWASQMERLAINERISAARERVESEGRKWGRPSRFDAAGLSKLKALRSEGRSIREIASPSRCREVQWQEQCVGLVEKDGVFNLGAGHCEQAQQRLDPQMNDPKDGEITSPTTTVRGVHRMMAANRVPFRSQT